MLIDSQLCNELDLFFLFWWTRLTKYNLMLKCLVLLWKIKIGFLDKEIVACFLTQIFVASTFFNCRSFIIFLGHRASLDSQLQQRLQTLILLLIESQSFVYLCSKQIIEPRLCNNMKYFWSHMSHLPNHCRSSLKSVPLLKFYFIIPRAFKYRNTWIVIRYSLQIEYQV